MSYTLKLEKAKKELNEQGLYFGYFFKIMPLLGIKLPPAYYRSFVYNFVSSTISFSLLWYFLSSAIQNINPENIYFSANIEQAIIRSLIFGLISGVFIALYYKWQAIKNTLSEWSKL